METLDDAKTPEWALAEAQHGVEVAMETQNPPRGFMLTFADPPLPFDGPRWLQDLMDADLARRGGSLPASGHAVLKVPEGSAFRELAQYLGEPGARWLEQEFVDPQVVLEF